MGGLNKSPFFIANVEWPTYNSIRITASNTQGLGLRVRRLLYLQEPWTYMRWWAIYSTKFVYCSRILCVVLLWALVELIAPLFITRCFLREDIPLRLYAPVHRLERSFGDTGRSRLLGCE